MKRFLSILLSVAMVMTMMPVAFAEPVSENGVDFAAETVETADEAVQGTETELAADDEVSYSVDGGAETTSSLAAAVAAIGTGTGTIKLLKDITTAAEIVMVGDIGLDLCGFTIDGNNTHRIFKVTGKLTLDDSSETKTGTIKGGYIKSSSSTTSPIGGAAVYLPADTNAVLVMNSGKFLENKAEGDLGLGGAILAEPNTTLTINGGSFIGNEAAFAGGAIGVDSAEFLMNGVKLSKNKSIEVSGTFYGAYGGGAIFLQITTGREPENVPTIKNCVFDSNSTTASQGFGGGAIISNEASLNITGCRFTNNTASAYRGGAIHAYASDVNIIDSIISDNEAKIGGGIYISNGGITTVSDSYIVDNKATSAGYDIANNSASAKYTMPTSYSDSSTGKTYDVKWYYDGLKNGTSTSRYSESTADEKTELTSTSEKCGLKAVYTEKVATYPVTITDPIYMAATHPGGTDSKIGTITVTGASDLAAVPEGTKLTLAITVADDTKAKNHTFVKWVVKTAGGEDVTVTDNKFTMPGEAVTVTAEYVPDIQMTFYAGPSADTTYECKNYTWNGDGTITYTMPGNKGTLTISTPNGFKLWQYIVDDKTKTPTVTANDVVTVTVNTNEGYTFNGIKSVKSQMGSLTGTFSNSGTYTFSVPVGTFNNYKGTQNAYIILDITTNQYNITKNYNTDEGEVIVIDRYDSTHTSIDKAYYKENLWVSIEPKANYKIKSVSCKAGENDVSDFAQARTTGKSYAFTMPASDVTINVEFELDACAITTDIKNGTISGITSPAVIGRNVSFTLAPQDDTYELGSYKVFKTGDENTTVTVTESNGTYTFTMPSYPVTVSAIFVKKTHTVTVEIQGETAGGTVSINKTSPVTVGEEVQVTVATNANYVLASLTMNGSPITDNKFTMPNEAVTIKAVFEKTKHALHYVESLNGTIQGITASDALPWGTVLNFTVTPNSYYVIDHVDANFDGVSTIIPQGADGKYTYTTTPANTTIKAYYKKQQFTVTASATTNGTITLGEPATLDWGENFTIHVKADLNYEIDTVTVDGNDVTVNNLGDYAFTMPTHDVTVSATFKKIKYTITGEGNNVTFGIPDKSTYDWGDMVKITVTPAEWYNIKDVYAKTGTTGITKVSGEENTYSFTMPASDITIVAVAERPNFTVTFDSQGGSAVTPATVANGAALTKPAVPVWAGRGFAGWYTDAACTTKYDFTTPVTGDLTLYARWFLWGDVNGDGNVDSADALLIRRCSVGLTPYSNIKNNFAGFVTGLISDSKMAPDSGDALAIRRYAVGLINRYKIEDIAVGYEFDVENNTYIPKA